MMYPKVGSVGPSEKKSVEIIGTGRGNAVSVPAHILGITEEQIEAWDSTGVVPGEHIQLAPSTAWVVVHNLGRPPVGISIYDSAGRAVGCKIEHETLAWNQFTVRPGLAVSGRVTWL